MNENIKPRRRGLAIAALASAAASVVCPGVWPVLDLHVLVPIATWLVALVIAIVARILGAEPRRMVTVALLITCGGFLVVAVLWVIFAISYTAMWG